MPIVSIVNQKGGVGKTTLTFQVGFSLSLQKKILLVDNDPQGNLTQSCGIDIAPKEHHIVHFFNFNFGINPLKIKENLSIFVSDISLAPVAEKDFEVIYSLKEGLENLKQKYDYILIDTLPSFGYLHLASLTAADYVLIPVKPGQYSSSGLSDLFNSILKVRKRLNKDLKILGIVFNLLHPKNVVLEKELGKILTDLYPDLVFKSKIYKRVALEEATTMGISILDYKDRKSAKEFETFLEEFLNRLEQGRRKNDE